MTEKPVLVGEMNPYGSDPRYALYPAPPHSAGGRLCFKVLSMRMGDYIKSFDRVNLCEGKWSRNKSRDYASMLWGGDWRPEPGPRLGGDARATHVVRPLILLGSKVCSAFGVVYAPFTSIEDRVLILPHPSGLCRAWNEPGAFERARVAVETFYPAVKPLLRFDLDEEDA